MIDIRKEEFIDFYILQNHDVKETCKRFNLNERQLFKFSKSLGIFKKQTFRRNLILPKEKLYNHLITECMSYEEVGKLYHLEKHLVRNWCREYNIHIPKECTVEARKRTNLKKYGCVCPLINEDIKLKSEETSLLRYGCKKAAESKTVRQRAGKAIKAARIKNHTTTKELMDSSEIYKEGLTRKEYFLKKKHETSKLNGTCGKSKEEDEIYMYLLTLFDDVDRYHFSNDYPFPCDFYIPSLDLYIEYQGFWMHGKEKFDSNNFQHVEKVALWKNKAETSKIYKHAIDVWTVRDPLKRETAKKNNLNWLEFFSIKEFQDWFNLINKKPE